MYSVTRTTNYKVQETFGCSNNKHTFLTRKKDHAVTMTVKDPMVQTDSQDLLSTKAPYCRAKAEVKARRPMLMSK